jgi:hypothetical protein
VENIEVQYQALEGEDNTSPLVVKILPVTRNKYKQLLEVAHILLVEFSKANAYPGEILHPDNENIWLNIEKLAKMLPLAGGGELEVVRLSDRDLLRIFFTRSLDRDEEGRLIPEEGKNYSTSEIARLNGFSFFRPDGQGMLEKAFLQAQKEIAA